MNSPERKPEWAERLQPRNWTLRVKLIAVVAVPTVLALVLGVLRVLDQSSTAAAFDQVDRIVALQQRFSALAVELQEERDEVAQFVAVRGRQDESTLRVAFDATDAARTEAIQALGNQSGLNSGSIGALRQIENNYFRLTQLRRQVLAGANDAGDLVAQYGLVIEPLLVFDNALTRQLSDPQITGLAQAIGALGEAREQASAQKALINAVLAAKALRPEQGDALRAADARLITATNAVRSVLTDDQQARYTGFAGPAGTEREQLKQSVVTRGRAGLPIDVPAETWNDRSAAVLEQINAAESAARDELQAISAAQQDEASNLAGINTVILLLAVLLGATIVFLVARTLIRALRTLRHSALEVAQRRLPEAVQRMREGAVPDIEVAPVPVTTREEIGEVARAFDAVHSQAVRLAAEQSTLQSNVSSMFANLSRRSQALAERQLKLIEQLEAGEQDPDQLSNLFQLDSLATRMRRNSENLLVLSGTDLSKRANQPVPVVDVLRAAVSEVEQYQRVVVQSPPDAMIAGRAASDIAHLLAELLDNATNFSAPDTQVVMTSQRTPDGSVLIEIVDCGVGMGVPELTDANARLARPTALDVSASRRMGLFVVGRLAARHGLSVRLGGGTPTPGTTASVTVPSYLVSGADGSDCPAPQLDGGRVGMPDRDFVPPQRGGVNGSVRPASLSARLTGADAPASRPGAAPSTNGLHDGQAPNGTEPSGPTGSSAEPFSGPRTTGGLPSRRPGRFLGQAPPAAPAHPPAQPEQPSPTGPEGTDAVDADRPIRQASGAATSAPEQRPVEPPPVPQREPAPPTEAFPMRSAPAEAARPRFHPPAQAAAGGLFAPAVPAGSDGVARSGDLGGSRDDLSETTPIFEEIASAWFLADRPVPVSYDDLTDLPSRRERPDTQVAAPARPAPTIRPPAPDPIEPERPAGQPTLLSPAAASFATGADDGWRASAAVAASDEDELTTAGLPKRRPRARLVPGAAGTVTPAVTPARTADSIRGRLSSYQDGVRQGRESRLRREAAAAGRPAESHDEETR